MPLLLNDEDTDFSVDSLLSLARHYNGPFWAYSSNIIRRRIEQLSSFDIVRFAQKSCSNVHILRLIRSLGVKVDAVSLGEIERALAAGYQPDCNDIIFTADLFSAKTLASIVSSRIPVNIGSIDMLYQLARLSKYHPIWLRINPGFGHGHSRKTNTGGENSKHGIWHTELSTAMNIAKKYSLRLIGLHMHIGSGVDYDHLKLVCNAMIDQVIKSRCSIEVISAGGGLSIPYHPCEKPIDTQNYFRLWDTARNYISNHLGHTVNLEIEPGRFLVAESGVLVSQVCAVKNVGKRYFILTDAGFNDLMRPVMYGSYHHISLLTGDGRDISGEDTVETVIAGPLCESGDVFTQDNTGEVQTRDLPAARVGDYLVFHDTGAYGASMSSNYNSRPLIPEVLFEGNRFREIRRAQTIQDLLELELGESSDQP